MIKKLKRRWEKAGQPTEDDFFPQVPLWLHIKRFIKKEKKK